MTTKELAPKLVDATNGNELRAVDHDGYIYFEARAQHAGDTVVMTSIRVDRDIALLALRRFVLT